MFDLPLDANPNPDEYARGFAQPDVVIGNLRSTYLKQTGVLLSSNRRLFILCSICHNNTFSTGSRRRVNSDYIAWKKTCKLPDYVVRTWMRSLSCAH